MKDNSIGGNSLLMIETGGEWLKKGNSRTRNNSLQIKYRTDHL